MKFTIGQVQINIFDMDLAKGHIRAAIHIPISGHEITLAGEYEKASGKPFYMSIELDRKDDKPHAEESAK